MLLYFNIRPGESFIRTANDVYRLIPGHISSFWHMTLAVSRELPGNTRVGWKTDGNCQVSNFVACNRSGHLSHLEIGGICPDLS